MAEELGLYLTMLDSGRIKKDLAGRTGKVSLGEASIQDEIILFSELNFGPYATVVDLIHASASFLTTDDEEHFAEVDMNVFQFIMDTVVDLVDTLEEESPLHGTLLRTEIEDLVPRDDGSAMYPIIASRVLVDILTRVMLFQFAANETLYDLQEETPLDFKGKHAALAQLPVREILSFDGTLTSRCLFRSAADYYHFLLLHFLSGQPRVAFCQCCGRAFVPKTKQKTLYCDRILKDGKTCKELGPKLKRQKAEKEDRLIREFNRAKRRMYKRYDRAEEINKKPSKKDLSYAEFYRWLERATRARDDCQGGKISLEEALEIINVP